MKLFFIKGEVEHLTYHNPMINDGAQTSTGVIVEAARIFDAFSMPLKLRAPENVTDMDGA